jgi:Fe-S oxidoreductase
MDMRRYQLLVESNFPAELNQLFKGLENKGNPWNMSASARMDWAKGLDFEVPVVGEDLESLESVDWLFWVGCAGAYEDRAKKTTRAVAELLDMAGVTFGVLGNGETCTGDPARRAGNEFVFQGLAQQNVETFQEYKVKKVVSTCAHCFNTLKNEYKDFGIELEVVHHTQLLNRLVREGRLTPVKDGAGAAKRSITYHDPCYLGRHNQVYEPPRELLQVLPGADFVEMERNSEKSFCCGAGGARMWMEENLGERINMNRTKEAVGTGADQIAVGCPFCRVMLSDGLTMQQSKGEAREEVEVLDVAQMLLASVKGEQATKAAPGSVPAAAPAAAAASSSAAAASTDVATKDEPEAGDVTVTEDTVTETADVGPAAKASGGTSLFDTPASEQPAAPSKPAESGSLFDTPAPEHAGSAPAAAPKDDTAADPFAGGSLFDTPAPEATPEPAAKQEQAAAPPPAQEKPAASTDLGAGGSLFDLGTSEPDAAPEPPSAPEPAAEASAPAAAPAAEPAPASDLGSGGSLFDIAAPEPGPAAEPAPSPAASEPHVAAESSPAEAKAAEPEPAPAAEAPAPSAATSTPATDADLSSLGSLFDLEAPAAEAAPAPAPEAAPEAASTSVPEPEPEPEVEPTPEAASEPEVEPTPVTSAATTSTPSTDVDISSMGSLFDIEAPATSSAPAAAAEPAPAAEPEPTAEPEPDVPADEVAVPDAPPSGADLSRAATFRDPADSDAQPEQADDPDTILDADDAPTEEPEPAATATAEEQPEDKAEDRTSEPAAADTPAHAPRTDVDISGSGSLFDL